MSELSTISCPMCGDLVAPGHPAHRGLLLNRIASLGARVEAHRERSQQLRKKRYSERQTLHRIIDAASMLKLEQALPRLEGTLRGLRFMEREIYHG
jgi:hypothetical protein